MEESKKLFEEIRQIKDQYRAEVTGRRKQWPRAIKTRVMRLSELGHRIREIEEQTGVSSHTVSAWRSQAGVKSRFHQLPVVVEPTKKLGTRKHATVTVRRKRKLLEAADNLVSVTVTTRDGFVIQLPSMAMAATMIQVLRRG